MGLNSVKIQGGDLAANGLAASLVVSTTQCKVFDIIVHNFAGGDRYIQGFDSATVPVDGTQPLFSIRVPTDSDGSISWPLGRVFRDGCVLCNSTTGQTKTLGGADSLWDVNYRKMR